MNAQDEIGIRLISESELQLRCDGGWVTLRQYDKGFTAAKRLFRVVRIAHGLACKCALDDSFK